MRRFCEETSRIGEILYHFAQKIHLPIKLTLLRNDGLISRSMKKWANDVLMFVARVRTWISHLSWKALDNFVHLLTSSLYSSKLGIAVAMLAFGSVLYSSTATFQKSTDVTVPVIGQAIEETSSEEEPKPQASSPDAAQEVSPNPKPAKKLIPMWLAVLIGITALTKPFFDMLLSWHEAGKRKKGTDLNTILSNVAEHQARCMRRMVKVADGPPGRQGAKAKAYALIIAEGILNSFAEASKAKTTGVRVVIWKVADGQEKPLATDWHVSFPDDINEPHYPDVDLLRDGNPLHVALAGQQTFILEDLHFDHNGPRKSKRVGGSPYTGSMITFLVRSADEPHPVRFAIIVYFNERRKVLTRESSTYFRILQVYGGQLLMVDSQKDGN